MTKLLLVDQDPKTRNVLLEILEKNSFKVDQAGTVDEALDALDRKTYHAVLSDIKLAKKSGLDLIRQMRSHKHEQSVILMTENPNLESAQQAVKIKAYDYLIKPVDNVRLLNTIHDAVRQYQLRIEEDLLKNRKKEYRQELERLVAEKVKRLNESEIKYKNLIEQSLFGVCVVQDNKFRYINKKFTELFRYSYKEIVDKLDFLTIVSPKDHEIVIDRHAKIFKGISDNQQFTFTALNKDQKKMEVEVWCGNVIFEGRAAIQGIISDISEKKFFQLRARSYEWRIMNEHKLAAIGQLATGIAHNLNTPISVILSNAELLELKNPGSSEMEKILRQAENMSSIIQVLLTKSRQEQIQEKQEIDLNQLIMNELEFLNANLEFKHNINKTYNFAAQLPKIYGIYGDFSQSIMNLLQNAVDAMYKRPTKELNVTTALENETIIVSIEDTGWGIDEKNYLKLFDPFYTTKPGLTEQKNDEPVGTGLGLSTVYSLLTPYGVQIDVNSKLDSGSIFVLKIPVKKEKSQLIKEKKSSV